MEKITKQVTIRLTKEEEKRVQDAIIVMQEICNAIGDGDNANRMLMNAIQLLFNITTGQTIDV